MFLILLPERGSEADNHNLILFGLRVCNAFTEQVHEVVYTMNTLWLNENMWIGLSRKTK